MSMSKSDYVKIAQMFAGEVELAKALSDSTQRAVALNFLENVIRSMADILAQGNPRFDRETFYAFSNLLGTKRGLVAS